MTGVASQKNALEKSALEGWSASGVENIGIHSAELPLASEPVAVAQEWSHSTVSSKASEQTASDEEREEIGGVASSGEGLLIEAAESDEGGPQSAWLQSAVDDGVVSEYSPDDTSSRASSKSGSGDERLESQTQIEQSRAGDGQTAAPLRVTITASGRAGRSELRPDRRGHG